MPGLLDLPRELRDQIIETLVHDSRPQVLPTPAETQRMNTKRDPNDLSARKIRYPSQAPAQPAVSAFILVNRQLKHEVDEVIGRLARSGLPALTLDLLVEDNKWLFPTLLSVLRSYTPVVSQLRVQIRPFVREQIQVLGDPFVACWHFGDLLNAILRHGPDLDFSKESKPFVVQELVIDMITDLSLVWPGGSELAVASRVKSFRDFAVAHIDGFLVVRHKRYHSPWGPIILSRVRKLKIVEEGETLLELDILERAGTFNVQVFEPWAR